MALSAKAARPWNFFQHDPEFHGAEIWVLDNNKSIEVPEGVHARLGADYLSNLNEFDIVFRTPGVRYYSPEIQHAIKQGVNISSATKLFFDRCPGKIIGVTGTKGKGTTSTLIYDILKAGGKDVFLAGNIGKPALEILPHITKKSWVVLEMSSFQLIDLQKSPHIAVALMVTEEHLDWHADVKEYVSAKSNIVRFQSPSGLRGACRGLSTQYVVCKTYQSRRLHLFPIACSRKRNVG